MTCASLYYVTEIIGRMGAVSLRTEN